MYTWRNGNTYKSGTLLIWLFSPHSPHSPLFKLNWSFVDFNSHLVTNDRTSKVCHFIHNDHQCEILWGTQILWDKSWDRWPWAWPATFHHGRWKWVDIAGFSKIFSNIQQFIIETPSGGFWFVSFANFTNLREVTSAVNWPRKWRDQFGLSSRSSNRTTPLEFLIFESNSSVLQRL